MMWSVVILLTLWFMSGSVAAQINPSFDCAEAKGSAEKLICKDGRLASLDRILAARYAAALAVVGNPLVGSDEAEEDLRANQRGWIGGRDECWKSDDPRACVETLYLQREGELVARYGLEEAGAFSVWRCGDSQANEVITRFFDTALPSVRIERGDRVSTGSLARTASGSRYDAGFGEYIWIRGNEARYRTPDPDGTVFECVAED